MRTEDDGESDGDTDVTSEVSKKEFARMDECQAWQGSGDRVSGASMSVHQHVPCSPVGSLTDLWLNFSAERAWRM